MKGSLLDPLALGNADKQKVQQACVKVFDRIQKWSPEEQAIALACSFLILCRAMKVEPQDVFTVCSNLMYDPLHSSRMDHRFDAMRWHLENQVLPG